MGLIPTQEWNPGDQAVIDDPGTPCHGLAVKLIASSPGPFGYPCWSFGPTPEGNAYASVLASDLRPIPALLGDMCGDD